MSFPFGKYRVKLRIKFIAVFVSLVLLPVLAVASITIIRLRTVLSENAVSFNRRIAQSAVSEIEAFISLQFTILKGVETAYPNFPVLDQQTKDSVMERVLHDNDSFVDLSVVDGEGREVVRRHVARVITPADLVDRSEAQEFLTVREQFYYLGPTYLENGKPFFNIARALIGPDDSFRGAIFAKIDARDMQQVVSRISAAGTQGRAYIVNEEGAVVAHPDISQVLGEKDFSAIPTVKALIETPTNNASLAIYSNELNEEVLGVGTPVSFSFVPGRILATDWFIIVEQPLSLVLAAQREITNFAILVFVGVLLVAVVTALIVAGRIVSPIEALHTAARQVGEGNLSHRVSIDTNDELEDLANSFNTMAGKLAQSINDLKEEERIISAERDKFAVVLSGITDAVIAVDLERNVILFNKTAEALFGIEATQAIGKPIAGMFTLFDKDREIKTDEYCPMLAEGVEGISFAGNELKLFNVRNQEHFVNIVSGRIKGGDRINLGCILTFHDITREQLIERMKAEFVSIAAHQLRTPLTGIKWSLEAVLHDTATPMPQDQRDFLQRAHTSNERMIRLIDDLLNTARIEEGRYIINAIPVDMREIVDAVVMTEQANAEKKNTAIIVENPPEKIAHVRADIDAMRVALQNVIENAVKYTPSGGRIFVSFKQVGQRVELSVRDNGIGIPPEQQTRIFTKFFRADNAMRMETDGSGLGLFITKNIVEAHGGTLWFESELGKGSMFTISLPAL